MLTCTSINCPERKSICCDGPSKNRIGLDGKRYYACNICLKPYIGGKCTSSVQDDKQPPAELTVEECYCPCHYECKGGCNHFGGHKCIHCKKDGKSVITCTSIDCGERKSICCSYPCHRTIDNEFICSNCGKPFVGGKCTGLDDKPDQDFYGDDEFIEAAKLKSRIENIKMNNYIDSKKSKQKTQAAELSVELARWFKDEPTQTYRSNDGQQVLTYEQYENYRGKYKHPTDQLLESIYIILHSEEWDQKPRSKSISGMINDASISERELVLGEIGEDEHNDNKWLENDPDSEHTHRNELRQELRAKTLKRLEELRG